MLYIRTRPLGKFDTCASPSVCIMRSLRYSYLFFLYQQQVRQVFAVSDAHIVVRVVLNQCVQVRTIRDSKLCRDETGSVGDIYIVKPVRDHAVCRPQTLTCFKRSPHSF